MREKYWLIDCVIALLYDCDVDTIVEIYRAAKEIREKRRASNNGLQKVNSRTSGENRR